MIVYQMLQALKFGQCNGQPQPAHGPMTGFGQVVRGPVCDCFGVRFMDRKSLINMLLNAVNC